MSILYLKIKPSKIWLSLLLILHLLAAGAVFYAAIWIWSKLILYFSLLASLAWHVFLHWQEKEYLIQFSSGEVSLQHFLNNELQEAVLKEFCYLAPWLVIIYFSKGNRRIFSQLIWVDSVSCSSFKQLKRFLLLATGNRIKNKEI